VIQLTRLRSAALPGRFHGANRKQHEKSLLEARRTFLATPGSKFDFLTSSMWSPAKPQLEAESNSKCGYCEVVARATAHCDVEHIRPKSKYWWLALCYDNYVLACQICNQTHKGDTYPVAVALVEPVLTGTATPADIANLVNTLAPDPIADDAILRLAAYETSWRNEDPDLIHPYHENPETFFNWVADDVLAEVTVEPAAAGGRDHDRAKATIDILGLNRERLRRLRYQTYQTLNALCLTLQQAALLPPALVAQVQASIQAAVMNASSFTGMSRHLVRGVHQLPL
jgi:hypothetical protein